MKNNKLFSLIIGFLLNTSLSHAQTTNITFNVDIYKNVQCSGKPVGTLVIDTAKSCNSYSYIDSKGATITGSQDHVRCYQNKVVYDKYPFSGKCIASESNYQGKKIIERDHGVPVNTCQETPSHDGPVYEKLSGYIYPGNEDCTKIIL